MQSRRLAVKQGGRFESEVRVGVEIKPQGF
jgi:hypothetical protein